MAVCQIRTGYFYRGNRWNLPDTEESINHSAFGGIFPGFLSESRLFAMENPRFIRVKLRRGDFNSVDGAKRFCYTKKKSGKGDDV